VNSAALVQAAVASILERDLGALRREVEAYPDEADLWRSVPGVSNPAGTLVLHLAGNLQHFIGNQLGGTKYVRDRAGEFARTDVSRAELLREIEATRVAVRAGLSRLTETQLTEEWPGPIAGVTMVTGEYLMHLTTHMAYHLGQVDFHRRAVTGSPTAIGAMRPNELSSARTSDVQA
jgi:uncharacterized damage-inducible protein DinB